MDGEQSRLSFAALVVALLAAGLLAACGSDSEVGSEQYRDKTDSPLLDFGKEGSEAELEAAEETVEAFLTSRAAGDWSQACGHVSDRMLAKIEHLAVSSTDLADKSCPSFLGAFTRLTAKEREEASVVDAGSLRYEDRKAFLFYLGADDVVYAMPLSREDDTWKVSSLSPQRLG